jgi:hypothetical protein
MEDMMVQPPIQRQWPCRSLRKTYVLERGVAMACTFAWSPCLWLFSLRVPQIESVHHLIAGRRCQDHNSRTDFGDTRKYEKICRKSWKSEYTKWVTTYWRAAQNEISRRIIKSYPRNRPWRPIGLRDVKDPTLSSQSAHKVVSPTHRPHFTPQKHYFFLLMFPVLISVRGWLNPRA